MTVLQNKKVADIGTVHIMFVGEVGKAELEKILEHTKDESVLVVGEEPGFAASKGVINFIIEKKRVRFEINPSAVKRARLVLSSELLKLAKIVEDK